MAKTPAVHDLILQAWWDETLIYSDYFFDMTSSLGSKTGTEVSAAYSELQMVRNSFEQAEYPPFVSSARQHLLNSMADVVHSFRAFFQGKMDVARVYMNSAQDELLNMESEVYRLGLPRGPINQRLQ